ncbi:MAG: hypothetical protein RL662_54 [Bacteroidota bacterium]|jgi:phosphoribosylanthranilate isomerase
MKIKVCGMKYPQNIDQLVQLPIDYMGMIFYPKSPRFYDQAHEQVTQKFPPHIQRVGVFVNEDIDSLVHIIDTYNLTSVQLHGQETLAYCEQLIRLRPLVTRIKVFNVSEATDFDIAKDYMGGCEYFLFDTKTVQHGGSGVKFDWSILDHYTLQKPFFLSGGISAQDADAIRQIKHPQLYGLDLNSRFEVSAGIKNIELIDKFIKDIRA